MITNQLNNNKKSYRKQIKCIKSVTKTSGLYLSHCFFFPFVNLLIKRNIFRVALFVLSFLFFSIHRIAAGA